jgi:ankyrin repeat protein
VAIIQYLIDEKGFDVNTIIYNGNTYPHHYIKSKYGGEILTVIHKFIEWGFNVKITDSQGDTILHRLLYYSNISVRNISVPVSLINELLDTGAKVDTYGSTYKSPLLLLLVKEINYEDKKALVQRFISLGACNIPLGKNEGIKVINIKNVPSDILDLIPQNMFAE